MGRLDLRDPARDEDTPATPGGCQNWACRTLLPTPEEAAALLRTLEQAPRLTVGVFALTTPAHAKDYATALEVAQRLARRSR